MNLLGFFCFRRICVVTALFCFPVISAAAWAQFETRATNPFPEGSFCIATGDFNHDGKPDVVMTVNGGFAVALGNGDGTFQATVFYPTQLSYFLAVADFNGDGNLDIVTADDNLGPSTVSVYLGNGDGTFKTPPVVSGTTNPNVFVVVGDFNRDGKPDIAVSICLTSACFWAMATARLGRRAITARWPGPNGWRLAISTTTTSLMYSQPDNLGRAITSAYCWAMVTGRCKIPLVSRQYMYRRL